MGVGYLTEDILINALGDEEGIGELWDLYELIFNRKEFLKTIIVVIAIFVGIIGIALLIVGIVLWGSTSEYIMTGIGIFLILVAGAMLIFYFFRHRFLSSHGHHGHHGHHGNHGNYGYHGHHSSLGSFKDYL